jgi:hypothetical protein
LSYFVLFYDIDIAAMATMTPEKPNAMAGTTVNGPYIAKSEISRAITTASRAKNILIVFI